MEKMSMIYEALLELHAERVIVESLHKFQVNKLYEKIDTALLEGDQETFLVLTNELKSIQYK